MLFNSINWLLIQATLFIVCDAISLWKPNYLDVTPQNIPDTPTTSNTQDDTPTMLGITGRELINHLKSNINGYTGSRIFTGKKDKVSVLYDNLAKYLELSNGEDVKRHTSCQPERSIVAKLTRDVTIIPNVHSHNDYWRNLPLLEAIASGVTSVEADVWLKDNNTGLAVGHDKIYLGDDSNDYLQDLYLHPLKQMLDEVNCNLEAGSPLSGVFYNNPDQTLYLYIDFKSSDSSATYQVLREYLAPMIDRGYLTFYDTSKKSVIYGPVTIILTGNYPLDIGSDSYKPRIYTFLDAPLEDIVNRKDDFIANQVSLIASASMIELLMTCRSFPESQPNVLRFHELDAQDFLCLKGHIENAHNLGLQTRIWGVPQWPIESRLFLWKKQWELGVDFLNVDDLQGITEF
ncbi:HBR539Cp [Eremothecium sinecaudum]|uniref:Altered inheritance of mitochondria protein 6 n=1 Tax=Eremothecium sinecaudum TaxID=45286 RepID=A0A120K1J1_9SACH|nr:HBR539Cp [Eremothecium sinecaudum]AMD19440.1 HBR539Cp [Eremothecium sinecaudum]